MGTTPWKHLLLSALEANSHLKHSSYFQLATIGEKGRPCNRTVVFRGFEESSDRIQINTDCRTRKIQELKHCPYAEICWYFTESWEQFRISGRIEVVDALNPDDQKLQEREKAWAATSLNSRLQYFVSNPDLPSPNEGSVTDTFLSSSCPASTYCLLMLDPDQVDYLNLKSTERVMYSVHVAEGQKSWMKEPLNP